MTDDRSHLYAARDALERRAIVAVNEAELQAAVAICLAAAGIPFEPEVRLGASGIVDFLAEGGVGIETKVDGAAGAVARQLMGYATAPQVRTLLLVTTRSAHVDGLPRVMAGKDVQAVLIRSGLL